MRSGILMSSVAVVALATPAFAVNDRHDQGYSCTGMGAQCIQESLRLEDGNRAHEKSGTVASDNDLNGSLGATAAAPSDDDDDIADEIGGAADEAGDEISAAADEAGDEISEAADEAGDAIGDVFD